MSESKKEWKRGREFVCVHMCIRCLHIGKCLRSRLKCFRKKGLENEIGIIHKIYYVDPACSMQESVISFKELYSKCKFCFSGHQLFLCNPKADLNRLPWVSPMWVTTLLPYCEHWYMFSTPTGLSSAECHINMKFWGPTFHFAKTFKMHPYCYMNNLFLWF